MKNFFVIGCLIISCCSIAQCYWVEGEKDCWHKYGDMFCLEDKSGYKKWYCDILDGIGHVMEWREGKTTFCPKDHKCRCWEYDWYERNCECYYAREPPRFPSTGVMKWSGTYLYDDNWIMFRENPRIVNKHGEIHKDSYGRFLKKWTTIERWLPKVKFLPKTKVQFKILIPNGDNTYLRYTGVEDGSKNCSRDIVMYEGDLTSIWQKHTRHGKGFRFYNSTQKEGSRNIHIENWGLHNQEEEWGDEWRWMVEYDSVEDHAIPLQYYHRSEDAAMNLLIVTQLTYTYESLNKDDESFKLEDYCNV